MGVADSKITDLLDKMGWPRPAHAKDFDFENLQNYLENTNLEISLPKHAPQCDLSIADRKPKMYPRPAFIQEGYKMHLAMIGPSNAAKKQFTEFIPNTANIFRGPSQKLGPGRDAVPHYFLDSDLNRVVLWELPEINFKQGAEAYIREIGLLYVDVVFLLFSDKYLLTDIYCKLVVAMAVHGVPFFVICTQSSDDITEKEMQRIKMEFQQKDIHGIRIFNPQKPHAFVEQLLLDFVKEISWNRGKTSQDGNTTEGVSEAILGQTIRLKNLEKKPELNGRCGVCIGYHKDTDRYLARIITDGVEQDISLKEASFSILKPKMVRQVIRVKGLEKKPELNGRFGFVDEFLRESERYRVFLPDRPGHALVLALKPENIEKTESVSGATPISAKDSCLPSRTSSAPSTSSTTANTSPSSATSKNSCNLSSRTSSTPSTSTTAPSRSSSVPTPTSSPTASTSPTSGKSFDPPAREKPSNEKHDLSSRNSIDSSTLNGKKATTAANIVSDEAKRENGDGAENLAALFKTARSKEESETSQGDDLMTRIFAAESEPIVQDDHKDTRNDSKVEVKSQGTEQAAKVQPKPLRPRLQLSIQGLLSMRVWAVFGDLEKSEDIVDHLMDSGKTVFCISPCGDAHFTSIADLDKDPSLPKTEVLAFVDPECADIPAALEAARLTLRGVIFHPQASAYSPKVLEACRSAGITAHSADVLSEVEAGAGLPVAPLD